MTRRAAAAWIAVIAVITCARIGATWRALSQTVDEPLHIAAGFQWLTTNRYDLELEHPPLARIGFALGSLAAHAKARVDLPTSAMGTELLFTNGTYQHNLALARAGNLPWFLLALLVVALWADFAFGRTASVIAAALFSFATPVLGHAGLATTDMAACATVGAALYAFDRWLFERTWERVVILGIAIGVGAVAKMSFAFFFVPGALAIFLVSFRGHPKRDAPKLRAVSRPRLLTALAVMTLIAATIIWSVYKFEVGTLVEARLVALVRDTPPEIAARYAKSPGYEWVRGDLVTRYHRYTSIARPGFVDFVDWAKHAGYPSPKAGRSGHDTMAGQTPIPPLSARDRLLEPLRAALQWTAARVPLPAPLFIAGLEHVTDHSSAGHPAFFLGEYSSRGWWYYFPLLVLLKTPVAFLILFVIAAAFRSRFAVVALAMLVLPMSSSINIGIRHVLPLYIPMTVAASFAVLCMWQRGRAARAALVLLFGWLVIADIRMHPDYLAGFNELAARRVDRIATDSNIDWGQDGLRLATFVKQHQLAPLHVAYFGSVDPRRFGISFDDLQPNDRPHGWIAISQMRMIFGPPDDRGGGFKWLEQYPVRARIGRSIRVYYLP